MKYILYYNEYIKEFADSTATLGNTQGMNVVNISVMTNGNNYNPSLGSADKFDVISLDSKKKKITHKKHKHKEDDNADEKDIEDNETLDEL